MGTLSADEIKNSPIWHPGSQMKDYESFPPLAVSHACGPYIHLKDGRKIIDAIASWWCKSLGHGHPALKSAAIDQINRFEHIILSNTTNDVIMTLSQQLTCLSQTLKKVFYMGDGACAVEVAMKMSLHAHLIQGQTQRTRFIALENGYHGETVGALSVSDQGVFKSPYESLTFDVALISQLPRVNSEKDPLWSDCSAIWPEIQAQLDPLADTCTALILEPIVQGAAGMHLYSQDFLKRIRRWTQANNIHLIADEIMTGIGRTGRALACEHAGIEPDFACLSKGLTSGWLAFSAVLMTNDIYDLFYDDYETGRSFLHSHTFTGNALGARIASACLEVIHKERMYAQVQNNAQHFERLMKKTALETGRLKNIRHIGAIAAADLVLDDANPRAGYAVYKKAVEYGALLRPIGNTLYWLPPLNISLEVLEALQKITSRAIVDTLGRPACD